MYSESDIDQINAKIRRNWLVLGPLLAVILAGYIYALKTGVEWLAMVFGPLLFVAACYGLLAYVMPNTRYRAFLQDMQAGLSRDLKCTVVEIAGEAELQDGAMVLPVRVRLPHEEGKAARHASSAAERLNLAAEDDTQDERIVYLNASKRELFPEPGAEVLLHCYGRHIKSVERGELSEE